MLHQLLILRRENEDSYTSEKVIKCNSLTIEESICPYAKIHSQSSFKELEREKLDEKRLDYSMTELEINHNPKKLFSNEINQNSSCELTIDKRSMYSKALKTLAVYKSPPFLVIILSQSIFLYITGFLSTIVIDIAADKGIPESQAQFFLILSPIASTVGYICLGWVTDKGYLTAARYLAISFLCLSLSCCGYGISNSFLTMSVSVWGLGLCVSALLSVGPCLMYEFVEETKQAVAISSRFILNAPLSLTIGPTIGKYFSVSV